MPTVWGHRDGPLSIRVYTKYGEALDKIRPGDRLRIRIDKDRNGKFNSLFHLMLSKLVAGINRGPASTSIDELKQWVKLQKGWYDVVTLPKPTVTGQTEAVVLRSTAFDKMGEEEFRRFVVDACEMIRADLAPWVADAPEWGEVLKIISSINHENN